MASASAAELQQWHALKENCKEEMTRYICQGSGVSLSLSPDLDAEHEEPALLVEERASRHKSGDLFRCALFLPKAIVRRIFLLATMRCGQSVVNSQLAKPQFSCHLAQHWNPSSLDFATAGKKAARDVIGAHLERAI
jgi:hypothetical protein